METNKINKSVRIYNRTTIFLLLFALSVLIRSSSGNSLMKKYIEIKIRYVRVYVTHMGGGGGGGGREYYKMSRALCVFDEITVTVITVKIL